MDDKAKDRLSRAAAKSNRARSTFFLAKDTMVPFCAKHYIQITFKPLIHPAAASYLATNTRIETFELTTNTRIETSSLFILQPIFVLRLSS